MASATLSEDDIHVENAAVVTALHKINARQIREFLRTRWKDFSKKMDHCKMLFIGGIHGKETGELGPKANIKTMKNQFNIPDMREIKSEMSERGIETVFLDMGDFITNENTMEYDKIRLFEAIEKIGPHMLIIVICYSQTLNLKLFLESSGLLSRIKLERDLCIQSRGKIMTMTEVQKKFLQTMALEKNISKPYVFIEGQVGSGKTLLGLEVLKMKAAYYLQSMGIPASEGKSTIRVIVILDQGESGQLKKFLESELSENFSPISTYEIHNKLISEEDIVQIVLDLPNCRDFRRTLIMIDECSLSIVAHMHSYGLEGLEDMAIDFIHCNRYEDNGKKHNKIDEGTKIEANLVSCQLLVCLRSTLLIMTFAFYLHRHVTQSLADTIPHFSYNPDLLGEKPLWIEFTKEAMEEFWTLLSEIAGHIKNEKDVMLIYDHSSEQSPLNKTPQMAQMNFKDWKYVSRDEARGSEADVVIIYDFDEFDFEIFTRAKHHLIVITLKDKRYGQHKHISKENCSLSINFVGLT